MSVRVPSGNLEYLIIWYLSVLMQVRLTEFSCILNHIFSVITMISLHAAANTLRLMILRTWFVRKIFWIWKIFK